MWRDLSGQRFEHLTAQWAAGRTQTPAGQVKTRWLCLCDCGTLKLVDGAHLASGGTRSCGCWLRWAATQRNRTSRPALYHGHTVNQQPSGAYRSWKAMLQRCENPKAANFQYYGAAGVTVCERWHDFTNFLADMGDRPSGQTLDRWPNNAGTYEPGNCRWATMKEQIANRRHAV